MPVIYVHTGIRKRVGQRQRLFISSSSRAMNSSSNRSLIACSYESISSSSESKAICITTFPKLSCRVHHITAPESRTSVPISTGNCGKNVSNMLINVKNRCLSVGMMWIWLFTSFLACSLIKKFNHIIISIKSYLSNLHIWYLCPVIMITAVSCLPQKSKYAPNGLTHNRSLTGRFQGISSLKWLWTLLSDVS